MSVTEVSLPLPSPDGQRVANDHPPRLRLPGGFQDECPWQVSAPRRDADLGGTEPEAASRAVEHCPEHARTVGPWKAHPLHVPAGGNEGHRLPVRKERVLGDRREGTTGECR